MATSTRGTPRARGVKNHAAPAPIKPGTTTAEKSDTSASATQPGATGKKKLSTAAKEKAVAATEEAVVLTADKDKAPSNGGDEVASTAGKVQAVATAGKEEAAGKESIASTEAGVSKGDADVRRGTPPSASGKSERAVDSFSIARGKSPGWTAVPSTSRVIFDDEELSQLSDLLRAKAKLHVFDIDVEMGLQDRNRKCAEASKTLVEAVTANRKQERLLELAVNAATIAYKEYVRDTTTRRQELLAAVNRAELEEENAAASSATISSTNPVVEPPALAHSVGLSLDVSTSQDAQATDPHATRSPEWWMRMMPEFDDDDSGFLGSPNWSLETLQYMDLTE